MIGIMNFRVHHVEKDAILTIDRSPISEVFPDKYRYNTPPSDPYDLFVDYIEDFNLSYNRRGKLCIDIKPEELVSRRNPIEEYERRGSLGFDLPSFSRDKEVVEKIKAGRQLEVLSGPDDHDRKTAKALLCPAVEAYDVLQEMFFIEWDFSFENVVNEEVGKTIIDETIASDEILMQLDDSSFGLGEYIFETIREYVDEYIRTEREEDSRDDGILSNKSLDEVLRSARRAENLTKPAARYFTIPYVVQYQFEGHGEDCSFDIRLLDSLNKFGSKNV